MANIINSTSSRLIMCLGASILTTLALSMKIVVPAVDKIALNMPLIASWLKLSKNFNASDISWSLLSILLAYAYNSIWTKSGIFKRVRCYLLLLSAFFGIVQVIGLSMNAMDSLDFLLKNTYQYFISSICILGYAILFYNICLCMFLVFDNYHPPRLPQSHSFMQSHIKLISFLIILAAWTPWLVAYYPGSALVDGMNSVLQILGVRPLSDHHPVLATEIIGQIFRIGRHLNDDNTGIFCYVLLQSLTCTLIYAHIVTYILQRTKSLMVAFLSILYYSLISYFGGYSQAFVKDTIFSSIFTLFLFYTVRNLTLHLESSNFLIYLVLSFFTCLLRHNALYSILPTLLLLLFCDTSFPRKKIMMGMGTLIIALFLTRFITLQFFHVTPGSSAEMFSIPLQQIARFCRDYPQDLTKEEKQIIERYLPMKKLATLYDPNLSDPVKNALKKNLPSQKKPLFDVWYSLFKAHPRNHFESFFANSYGYYSFTPPIRGAKNPEIHAYNAYAWIKWGKLNIDYQFSDTHRKAVYNYHNIIKNTPIGSLFHKLPLYTWFTLICALYFIYKKTWKLLIFVVPFIMHILTCVASPVNGHPRYFLPIIAGFPILLCLIFAPNDQTKRC